MSSHPATKSSTSRKNVNKENKKFQVNLKNSQIIGDSHTDIKSQVS